MDDDWGYPCFRKPPRITEVSLLDFKSVQKTYMLNMIQKLGTVLSKALMKSSTLTLTPTVTSPAPSLEQNLIATSPFLGAPNGMLLSAKA